MPGNAINRLARVIDREQFEVMTALELQKCMHDAGIGLDRRTIERHLKEAYFEELLSPISWKVGRTSKGVDKTLLGNVARWRRGPAFSFILNDGHRAQEAPEKDAVHA